MNFGPYIYDSKDDIFEKKFGERSFTVILSSAFNAGGIIGSEFNGIAIMDDNYRNVLVDRQVRDRGFLGSNIRAEFNSIKEMNWAEFSEYVRSCPRYRQTADDINSGAKPDAGDPIDLWIAKGAVDNPSGPDLRTAAMKAENESGKSDYSYPQATREEMIVFLATHKSYHPMNYNNGGYVISWDIKVHGAVSAEGVEGFNFDPAFNERWKELEQSSNTLFDEACAEAMWPFQEGNYINQSDEDITAKFYTNGRQNGHLVLSDWNGPKPKGWASCPMAFSDREHFISWLKDLENDDLVSLYGLVRSVDADTANPTRAVNYSYASLRQSQEEQWAEEMKEDQKSEMVI